MRNITQQSVKAFFNKTPFKKDNTETYVSFNNKTKIEKTEFRLHGNLIAERIIDYNNNTDAIFIYDGNHQSVTTKERLNGILNYLNKGYIYQKDFKWFYYDSDYNISMSFEHGLNVIKDGLSHGFLVHGIYPN